MAEFSRADFLAKLAKSSRRRNARFSRSRAQKAFEYFSSF
jgi:hypothetical protein